MAPASSLAASVTRTGSAAYSARKPSPLATESMITAARTILLLPLASACSTVGTAEREAQLPHDWRDGPHHFSVLLASTVEDSEESASGPTIGLDYEYRVSDFLGLGTVLEYAFEDIDATTVLAVADLHVTPQFIVQTGPGVEFRDGDDEFVYRLGVLYEWERGGYTLSPQLHYDATSGDDAIVFGIALGLCF